MKWWNQLTRKRDGWVERKRRFQTMFAAKIQGPAGEKVPAVAGVTVDTRVEVPNRGGK